MRNKIKTCAIIPARMAATRFPGKPLAKILGISLIEHTRRRAVLSGLFDRVFVATCDQVILDEVEKYGGSGFMTSASHQRCTDRIEEVARKIDSEIIVNIQGDEPLVMGESLHRLINPFFESDEALTTNIVNPVFKKEELESPNVVKAVLSNSKKILYMSRSIIPGNPFTTDTCYYKQTGLIAFRKDLLHRYARLAPTPLEIKESCDMLRLIENDVSVQGVVCEHRSIGVDIPEQIIQVEEVIKSLPEQRRVYEMIK